MIDIRKLKHGYWWDAEDKFILLKHRVMSLRELTIQVTDRCNKACPKCNKVNMTSEDMPAKEVIRIINEARQLGLKHVHFTGGEPTIHPNFASIVRFCVDKGLRVDMSTNGEFRPEYADELNRSGIHSINISWDFINQVPKCLELPETLKMRLFVNHMVMPENFRYLEGFLYVIKNSKEYDKIIDIQLMPPRGTAERFIIGQINEFNEILAPKCLERARGRFPMVEAKVMEILPKGSDKGIYHREIQWPCHRAKAELRAGVKGFTTCTYLYRDGKVTAPAGTPVKEAWLKCRAMARKAPPLKMCATSCSPEVCNFNYFVEESLK